MVGVVKVRHWAVTLEHLERVREGSWERRREVEGETMAYC